jgi:excinuclease ABC subunit A
MRKVLSAYVRQFLNRMDKPDVDYIKGLSPAIAIEQKVSIRTPRSTVGSMTEIYDYLRLFYSRLGKTISPVSGKEVKKDDVKDVLETIKHLKPGAKAFILSAFKQHRNRDIKEELTLLLQKGFSRIYVSSLSRTQIEHPVTESLIIRIEDVLEQKLEEFENIFQYADNVFVLIDRIVVKDFDEDDEHRLSDSIGTAFYEGEGDVYIEVDGGEEITKRLIHFNNRFELDGMLFEEPAPNLFSFNNPFGACPTCEGFSMVLGIDEDLVIPNKLLSVYEGAVAPWKGEKLGKWRENFIKASRKTNFPVHTAIADLTETQYKLLWEGNQFVEGINDFFKEVEQNLYKVQYRVIIKPVQGQNKMSGL